MSHFFDLSYTHTFEPTDETAELKPSQQVCRYCGLNMASEPIKAPPQQEKGNI